MSQCNPFLTSQRLHTSEPHWTSKLEVKRDHPTGYGYLPEETGAAQVGPGNVGGARELWKVRLPYAALLQILFLHHMAAARFSDSTPSAPLHSLPLPAEVRDCSQPYIAAVAQASPPDP